MSITRCILPPLLALAWLSGSGCKPECSYDTDCAGTSICSNGKCADPAELERAISGQCKVSSDCSLNETCLAGICEPRKPENGGDPESVCAVTRSTECDDDLCLPSGALEDCDEPPCKLILDCLQPVGKAKPAHSCLEDAHCSTGWCRDGVCASVCLGDGSCPNDYSCVEVFDEPPWGDQAGILNLCLPGSFESIPCDAPAMCPSNLTCTYRYPEDASTRCSAARGAGVAGQLCSIGGCESGVCVDNGRCTQPCLETLDCEAGTICDQIRLTGLPGEPVVSACVPPHDACFNPFDCRLRNDLICSVRTLLGRDHPIFRCRDNAGVRTGEPCSTNQECSSGLCTPEGLCGQLCDVDTDCRCAFDADCRAWCEEDDDCWLDWTCGAMPFTTAERTYTVRTCRPR